MNFSEVIQTKDGYFRFINRENKALTSGFPTKEILLKYKNDFGRTDKTFIDTVKERFLKFKNKGEL